MRFFLSLFLFALALACLGFAFVGYWPMAMLGALCALCGAANAMFE